MTKAIEVNLETNEIIERDFTKEEVAEQAVNQASYDARIAAAKVREKARQDLLDRLGITAEEASLLLA
jgi:hypothetical protein